MRTLQFRKEEMYLRYSLLVFLVVLLFQACERENVTQPEDDGLPPVAPAMVSVFRERDGEVGIEWIANSESDLRGYNIYRSINGSEPVMIDFTIDEYYIDYFLEYDTTYYYYVTAIDIYDGESSSSQTVSAMPQNELPPDAPYLIEINARNWDNDVYIHLFWYPVADTDLEGYEIYRDTLPDFTPGENSLVGLVDDNEFDDIENLQLLKTYYYKIKSIDKGGLRSITSGSVSDMILNKPVNIFPENNSHVGQFSELEILTVSEPANYKILIQSNQYFGIVEEINFSSNAVDSVIAVSFSSFRLENFKDYYWRIFTYTKNYQDPNSISDLLIFSVNSDL